MKEPKFKVPTPEELTQVSEKLSEKEVWYDIVEWQMSVKLRPVTFGKYLDILRDNRLQAQKNERYAELQSQLAWVGACLTEPQLSFDQLQKLADADTKAMMNLALKCQVISGNLPEEFDPEVAEAKNVSEAVETTEDTTESMPPALSTSDVLPPEADSPTPSL